MVRSTTGKYQSSPIESYLVHMNLKRKEAAGDQPFEDTSTLIQKVSDRLLLVRKSFRSRDFVAIDTLAREVLENALKIGASDLLNLAIDLQTLARRQDEEGIIGMMALLDAELARIDTFLSESAG